MGKGKTVLHMNNTDSEQDDFDRKLSRVFREQPVAMPELVVRQDTRDDIMELSPEHLDHIQAAGGDLMAIIKQFLRK